MNKIIVKYQEENPTWPCTCREVYDSIPLGWVEMTVDEYKSSLAEVSAEMEAYHKIISDAEDIVSAEIQTALDSVKKMGVATLVAGTVTVSNTYVVANSIIQLTCQSVGGTQGMLSVGTIVAGTSFVIDSSDVADTSIIYWEIKEPL